MGWLEGGTRLEALDSPEEVGPPGVEAEPPFPVSLRYLSRCLPCSWEPVAEHCNRHM